MRSTLASRRRRRRSRASPPSCASRAGASASAPTCPPPCAACRGAAARRPLPSSRRSPCRCSEAARTGRHAARSPCCGCVRTHARPRPPAGAWCCACGVASTGRGVRRPLSTGLPARGAGGPGARVASGECLHIPRRVPLARVVRSAGFVYVSGAGRRRECPLCARPGLLCATACAAA
eukprot:5693538-Prymnesium_polylepis.1